MIKMTKAQQKRMVRDITSKAKKIYLSNFNKGDQRSIITTQDMAAIEKLTSKWLKRIG